MTTVTLYRPTGTKELALVEASGFAAWPPRLADQPIFYPVSNEAYAIQIARDWNTKTGDKVGFVTRFEVDAEFLSAFEKKIVGGRTHEEYWIPAERLPDLNRAIVGKIDVIGRYTEEDRLSHERELSPGSVG